jgi:Zn-dependent protease
MVHTSREVIAVACRWLGRTLALLLFLFWGAFFLEHLSEWLHGPQRAPPLWVWVSQVLHLGMLVGLALMLRWDRLGALVTALGTTAFFASIGMHRFPWIALLNLLPIAGFAVAWCLHRPPARPTGPVPEGSSG